tara:strand:- start:169 stop:2352 length:2184 start_codon:yes stop_codon:yes gene_type:complete
MKIIFKLIISILIILLIILTYLSIFGIETDRFNSQIKNKIKNIDNKTEVKLNKIKLVLDPFKFKIKLKTVGTKLKNQNVIIEIESLKTQVSLKALLGNKFSIENLEISTNSIEIKNLIKFIRFFQNTPELFILEKVVKNGYLIADIKLEFDSEGNIKNNYEINGFLRDTKLDILKKYNFQKINFIFEYQKDNLLLNDIAFSLNKLNFISENISLKKDKDDFLIKGKVSHNKLEFDEKNLNLFVKPFLPKIDLERLKFSSKNDFSFKLNKKFEFKDITFNSEVFIDKFSIINKLDFKDFFPNINNNLSFLDHELSIKYLKNDLYIDGKGNILLQDKNDFLTYSINKTEDSTIFKTSLDINDDLFKINFLNYEKSKKDKTSIKLEGSINRNGLIFIKSFNIKEKKNKINITSFHLNKKFEVIKLGLVNLDYIDKEKQKNFIQLYLKNSRYHLKGTFFNANKLIDNLLFEDNDSNFLNIDTRVNINIDKIYLDNEHDLSNFKGDIFFKNKQITNANLVGNFTGDKRLKFTITSEGNNKITTLFMAQAKPIVKRYKFIKGFDEGILDFYSSKTVGVSNSTLKIYDFKLKELPVLTKILTLASLQGIADILSGEGIRFEDFEMNFKNEGSTMTINEIYAIGPAISILMDGYVEKDKIISLRGTLVPATTINKFIGSIPVLGKLLVGTKTGEGVFGVSFKIKGPPKDLDTTVNPIKTLTPRFITRTLEKIKKD